MTAPTLTAYSETAWNSGGTKATASFSWSAGDVIVVVAATEDGGHPVAAPTGTGLTFSAVTGASVGADSSHCGANAWVATPGSSGSSTISSTGATTARHWGMGAWQWTGSAGVGNVGALASTALTVSLTRAGNNSCVAGGVFDFNAGSTSGYGWTPTVGHDRDHAVDSGRYTFYVADWGDQGSSGSTSYGLTGVSGGPFTKLVIEVKGSAGTNAPAAVAAGTAAVTAARPAAAVTAGVPHATAAVTAPVSAAGINTPAAAAASTAAAAMPAVAVEPAAAVVLASAPQPTVSTSGNISAPAGVASAAGVAPAAEVALTVDAAVAAATAVAPQPIAAVTVNAGVAAVAAAAPSATVTTGGGGGSPQTVFGQAGGGTLASDTAAYTLGMEFSLSADAPLTGIWFYSVASAVVLPGACAIYDVASQTIVTGTSNTSPTWSDVAGAGWVKCTYDGSVTLTASTAYKVVAQSSATANWYSVTGAYWSSGAGGSGITSGIITAPNDASSATGQDSYITPSGGLNYPGSSFNASNYWVDVELTPAGGSSTNAPAGVAIVAAVALAPTVSVPVQANAGVAQATASIGTPGGVITDEAGSSITDEAGSSITDESAAAAVGAQAAIGVEPAAAVVLAAAAQPSVSTSGSTNAPAAVATAGGVAPAPTVAVTVNAGVPQATATAPAATAASVIAAPAGAATATASAPAATAAETVNAGVASSAATAPGATVSTFTSGSANAQVATAAAAAPQPGAAVTVNAGVAAAAAVAPGATVSTFTAGSAPAGVATASAVAPAASVPQGEPAAAVAAATAPQPVVAVGARAGVASAAAAAAPVAMASTRAAAVATAAASVPAAMLAAQAQAQAATTLAAALAAQGHPVEPFTVGSLTASDAPAGALTASAAPGGSGGVLTASETRTGGPG